MVFPPRNENLATALSSSVVTRMPCFKMTGLPLSESKEGTQWLAHQTGQRKRICLWYDWNHGLDASRIIIVPFSLHFSPFDDISLLPEYARDKGPGAQVLGSCPIAVIIEGTRQAWPVDHGHTSQPSLVDST